MSPRMQDARTDTVKICKIYHTFPEIWGKIGNGQSVSNYVRPNFPQNGIFFFKIKESCQLENKMPESCRLIFLDISSNFEI